MATTGRSFDSGQFMVHQNDFDGPGDAVDWHPHKIPHTTLVRYGKVRISLKYPDRIEELELTQGDEGVHVPAKALHRIECLEGPARTDCMFLHRDHNWNIVDRFKGFMAAYA